MPTDRDISIGVTLKLWRGELHGDWKNEQKLAASESQTRTDEVSNFETRKEMAVPLVAKRISERKMPKTLEMRCGRIKEK
jgi:hypothetical protein